ncbi:MAG: AAA family ATPase [Candidatus Sericytochromatia bacterium]|nr:AAA family ATPase [Candidatus Sericytochromatia bacterium]
MNPLTASFQMKTLDDLLSHFGLVELPFQLSEDPRWQYLTPHLKACLTRTIMGIESRQGMVSVVGAYGAGKSMLVRRLVTILSEHDRYDVQVISNPSYTGLQLLKHICDLYGVARKGTKLGQFDAFAAYLMGAYQAGRHPVLIIDEAQLLSDGTRGNGGLPILKQINNFSAMDEKSISVVLVGQEALRHNLAKHPEIESRIFTTSTLDPLNRDEVAELIEFRLQVAGWGGAPLFAPEALEALYVASRGIPRRVCTLAFNMMQAAFADGAFFISGERARAVCVREAEARGHGLAAATPAITLAPEVVA